MPSPRRTRRRLALLAALSVVAHAVAVRFVLIPLLEGFRDASVAMPEKPVTPIDIALIEPTVLNPYAAPSSEEEQNKAVELKVEEAKKPEERTDLHGQVVDTPEPNVEIRPDEAKYLSTHDTKVEHETKAPPGRGEGPGASRAASALQRPPQHAQPEIKEQQHRQHGEGELGKLAMRGPTPMIPRPSETLPGPDETMRQGPDGTEAPSGKDAQPADRSHGRAGASKAAETQAVRGQEEVPNIKPSDLRPSNELLARAISAGGTSDYLKDVDEGAETWLNSKRWKYSPFFSRVKSAVAQKWRPEAAYRFRDPTGQIYGQKNRYTLLKVSLRPDGSLNDLLLEKPCGVEFLDDEAVSAFKEAQPFPNPPEGLVDPSSHLITFRFGFYFEIAGAPVFRVIRQ